MTVFEGRCYCGAVRYRAEGEPMMKAECFCRECQFITGGASVLVMGMPAAGYEVTQGAVKGFTRQDLANAVTREFCPDCGTHLSTRAPALPGVVIVKVGSLDDPKAFGGPECAIFTCDAQPYHRLPTDIPVFSKGPERPA